MSQPLPEHETVAEDYQPWSDLQDVLEERDREWWAEAQDADEDGSAGRARPALGGLQAGRDLG